MLYSRNNTIDYLDRFRNVQKLNEAFNVILITRGVQENGMKILFPLQVIEFDSLQDDYKK